VKLREAVHVPNYHSSTRDTPFLTVLVWPSYPQQSYRTSKEEKAMSNFDRTEKLYKNIVLSLIETDWFSSEEYNKLTYLAKNVFDRVRSKCPIFIGVVCGTNAGYELGHQTLDEGLCFPKRFLKKPSSDHLPHDLKTLIDSSIEKTFYLGLFNHLITTNFPTRSEFATVDVEKLFYQWSLQALVADSIMKEYSKHSRLTLPLFESHYQSNIEPILKSQFKMKFWTLGKCKPFFKNLFFAGALLGKQFDSMTYEY